jgi:hypothetical protein
MPIRFSVTLLLVFFAAVLTTSARGAAPEPAVPATIDFNRDVRPILSNNCYFCHGPDKNKRKADLRLDTRDGIFSHLQDHVTVVAGHPEQSELFRRVIAADPAERMPDPKSNKRLSDRDLAVLKKWIEQGADWKGHWAYLKPVRPAVPEVEGDGPTSNPIDRFIVQRQRDCRPRRGRTVPR